ncbi:unnamed protein product [Oikopleura dioica]|uniref:Copper transport protein n=1 Tax=Oikopleura dioica TaxID=34765 RepID=E4Y6U1_OIKDI|nr:unnamed protein product [Oikopleura dioica]
MNHDHHAHHETESQATKMDDSQEAHSSSGHASAFTSHLGQTLLFSAWEIKDEKHLAIACVAVAVVAVINEGLKAARQKLTHKTKPGQFLNKTYAQKLFNRWHIINTILSLLQNVLSYALMLAFMTFQTWICVSILLAHMVGYFVFGVFHSDFAYDHC